MPGVAACDSYTPLAMVLVSVVTELGCRSGPSLALAVVEQLLGRAFRASFCPLWMHGHSQGVRISRLDHVQHAVMHDRSCNHLITSLLDDATMLHVQRLALRTLHASTMPISAVVRLVCSAAEAQAVKDSKTADDALAAVCGLAPHSGAKVVLFCKVVALKNTFVSFDLGGATRRRQLHALRKRFEVEAEDEASILEVLPPHAHQIFYCLECGKKHNACVDLNARVISHNEVGIAQSMLRVGGIGQPSEIRCARRSSAALRTALQKEAEAEDARIDGVAVDAAKMTDAFRENGSTAHAARLRRDVKACTEQLNHAKACGDRPLVIAPILGRVVRLHNKLTPSARSAAASCSSTRCGATRASCAAAAATPPCWGSRSPRRRRRAWRRRRK